MNIFDDHERAVGMRQCGHVWSTRGSTQKLRRYRVVFVRAKLARARAGLFKATVIGLLFNVVSMFDPNIGFARPAQVLAFGDSLTSGLGLPTSQAFPARLEAWLRQQGLDVFIINAGVAGDTTTDGLARIDWSLATKPDFVILALGAND